MHHIYVTIKVLKSGVGPSNKGHYPWVLKQQPQDNKRISILNKSNNMKSNFTLYPVSAFQTCILPSVEPLKTNCESGLKEASNGMPLLFNCP